MRSNSFYSIKVKLYTHKVDNLEPTASIYLTGLIDEKNDSYEFTFIVKKLESIANDHLFDAILSLENREECYKFFEDVCTINELNAISQRFEVAKMLREKKTYLDIAEKTGASTATISRVNRSLNYGNDAYDMVFERMNWDETEE
mgnify:CR=1 FL=1